MTTEAGHAARAAAGGGLGLRDRVLELVAALRRAGVPIAVSESLDAVRAAALVDLAERAQLREALAATLVTAPGHRIAFDPLFDLFFPPRPAARDGEDAAGEARDIADFLAELADRVAGGDEAAVRRLAREAVGAYGGVQSRNGSTSYFAYRVWGAINLKGVLRRIEMARPQEDPFVARLARSDHERRLQRFRAEVEAELRRRAAERRGADEVAANLARPLPEEVDFFRIGAEDQAAMRRAVRPLARRLATRLALRRRHARAGRLDPRRTLRRALATGGIPADPVFRAKRVHRPEIVLLCDLSGSVASFARFTLMFVHALQGQFSRVRSFAFIDTVDEVTRFFAGGDFAEGMQRLSAEADLVWLDGHSDYGNALQSFSTRYADTLTRRTTVLVLGDARNNYRAGNAWVLDELRRRARHVYWLNPEPRAQWGSGDSLAPAYAEHVDAMVECRNLRQLAAFVELLGQRHAHLPVA